MAKTKGNQKTKAKKVLDDDAIAQETSAEVDIDIDAAAIEADVEVEIEADADVEVLDVDADAVDVEAAESDGDDRDGEDQDEDDVALPPPAPTPKITWTALILILLNWVAAPTFLIVAYMDHTKRLEYSYRTLVNHAQMDGLPLRDEEDNASVSIETRPATRLTPEQLKNEFKSRKGVTPLGPNDKFQAVEDPPARYPVLDETTKKVLKDNDGNDVMITPPHYARVRLRPSEMTDEFLEDIYGSSVLPEERFRTLEDAIEHLKTKLPGDIADAAKEVTTAFAKKKDDEKRKFVKDSIFIMTWDSGEAKKMEDQIAAADAKELDDLMKRALVQKILYPLAQDIWTVDRLDEALAKAKGADLDGLVDEAVQRKLYYDILAPLNVFRPGDIKVADLDRFADRDKVKMERVKELLDKRLDAAIASQYDVNFHIGKEHWGNPQERDSIEKRQKIAFILFMLGHVQIPLLDKKLHAKGIERAQTVSGLHEFTNASIAYVQALRVLERRQSARVISVREGDTFGPDKKEMRTPGFIDAHETHVQRLHRITEHVDAAQKRLDDLKLQRDHAKKIYNQRVAQHKDIADKLIKARQGTEKYAKELRGYQDRLHEALLELSDAADTNFRLEAEIRALELSYFKTPAKKGAKK